MDHRYDPGLRSKPILKMELGPCPAASPNLIVIKIKNEI